MAARDTRFDHGCVCGWEDYRRYDPGRPSHARWHLEWHMGVFVDLPDGYVVLNRNSPRALRKAFELTVWIWKMADHQDRDSFIGSPSTSPVDSWPEDEFAYVLVEHCSLIAFATVEPRTVSVRMATVKEEDKWTPDSGYQIPLFHVTTYFRGQGIGTRLLHDLAEHIGTTVDDLAFVSPVSDATKHIGMRLNMKYGWAPLS